MNKKFIKIFLFFFFLIIIFIISLNFKDKKDDTVLKKETEEIITSNSNIIKDVNYFAKDGKGNEYTINASQGEIDQSNTDIIYLTNVKAIIKIQNSDNITILSDYGKYNTKNFDTIFSKNVIINYEDNNIKSNYLDFSLERNSMIISKNVIYKNKNNVLKADTVEIDLETKDTKIFMLENNKKVNIKSIN